ncbi:hypothetical protein EV121DRAFT_281057 [Schizophyllum commune]
MGQYWCLRDMDARTSMYLGKLGESYFGMGEDLHKMLCREDRSTSSRWMSIGRAGMPYLRRAIFKRFAPSAEHRLICVGDYTEPDDIPPGLELTEEEKEELDGTVEDEDDGEEYCATLSNIPSEGSIERRDLESVLFGECRWKWHVYYIPGLTGIMHKLIPRRPSEFDPTLVLRNLSTRQYVRGQAIKEFNQTVVPGHNGREGMVPCLADAIMPRVCWASDGSTSLNYEGPLQVHRGVWAGNRFDIVPEDLFLAECKNSDQPWTDVSAEVIAEVEAIWVAEEMLKPGFTGYNDYINLLHADLRTMTPSAIQMASTSFKTSSDTSVHEDPFRSISNVPSSTMSKRFPAHTPRCRGPSYGIAMLSSEDQQTRAITASARRTRPGGNNPGELSCSSLKRSTAEPVTYAWRDRFLSTSPVSSGGTRGRSGKSRGKAVLLVKYSARNSP